MPIVPFQEILRDAFTRRYGVGAFNVFDDLTLAAVLRGAEAARAPVIVQTSVKTVKSFGIDPFFALWTERARRVSVPVCLHLDHCPERAVISACLAKGWGSVLFDASELPLEENRRQTIEVVAEARRLGAGVEGEIEGIQGVEDGVGSDAESERQTLAAIVEFIAATGIDCFAPAIGNAHGLYQGVPRLDAQRVTDIVASRPIPMALHGGTGLTEEQFQDLISRGCAKVNISTALKMTYMQSTLAFLRTAEEEGRWDPPSLFRHVDEAIAGLVTRHLEVFGAAGKAG